MYTKAIQNCKGSIFPIIATNIKNGKRIGRQVAGTGFFIDEKGHFATALHAVTGDPKMIQFGSLGNIPFARFKNAAPEAIIKIGQNPDLDLYVGKLMKNLQPPIPIFKSKPRVGTSIVIGGYPFPNIKKSPSGNLNFFTVRQYWQSTMIMDYLNMAHFDPRLKYNGFLVDKRTIPGMSGGPALNLDGEIVGMCTAQITRSAKDKVPNINGVCLDWESLTNGIAKIIAEYKSNNAA